SGLRPELELPSFLRFSGQPDNERFRVARQWLLGLCDTARRWVENQRGGLIDNARTTLPYVDLTFAHGLARLREGNAARELLARATAVLGAENDVHTFLLEAYDYRIKQVLDGKQTGGPLPPEQVEYLQQMEQYQRFAVERLLQYSRVLEPHQK